MLSLVNSTDEAIDNLIAEVSKSNITQSVQYELVDVLKTIKDQIQQAKGMGWL